MWVCKNCNTENSNNESKCRRCQMPKNGKKVRPTPFIPIILSCVFVILILSVWIIKLVWIDKQSSLVITAPAYTSIPAANYTGQSHNHEWGMPSFSWSNDYSTCTAMRKCSQCGEIEKETAPSTPRVMASATCTTSGKMTYTATFQTAAFTTQQMTKDIPASGHKWIAATFSQPKTCSICNLTEGWPSPTTVPPTLNELQTIMKSGRINTVCKADSGELVSLELPSYNELLDYPFRAVIAGGNGDYPNIFIMPKHKSGNGDLGVIRKGTEVWIVGKYEGKTSEGTIFTYYFFVADDGVMGWNNKNFFVRK